MWIISILIEPFLLMFLGFCIILFPLILCELFYRRNIFDLLRSLLITFIIWLIIIFMMFFGTFGTKSLIHDLNPIIPYAAQKSIEEIISEQIKKSVTNGCLIWTIPEKMMIHNTEELTAKITSQKSCIPIASIEENLKDNAITRRYSIKISPIMELKLKGKSFDIEEINSQQQPILDHSFYNWKHKNSNVLTDQNYTVSSWNWQVTPLKVGTHKLFLVATIIVKIEDYKDITYDNGLIEKSLKIVQDPEKTKYNNTQIIVLTLLLGTGTTLIILILLMLKNKMNQKHIGHGDNIGRDKIINNNYFDQNQNNNEKCDR